MAITTSVSGAARRSWAERIVSARGFAVIAFVAVFLAGGWSWRTLPVDAFPDITPPLVQVFTVTDGLSPQEAERYVTFPVEAAMTPRLFSSSESCEIRLIPPRILKAPSRWWFSCLT